ncbi:PhzF family phenazine biosynthesis isomerase [Spongiibacter nanhainus]|uniref:PhzF family phenazine biosynthesis isomerase n=1 Tax=Spongiibacter nanhainus TaxID=2794344 RepID=A0A7T4R2N2_9GAMM|nr:PhzF family phenazine biosynthesis isomerase [Spongiibacter nanhainus]QQD19107.1 PhzF family phenazine biosynthesis isomerase [Spongiibacter nanhainus]
MKYYLVDAFVTERAFSGNPAAICLVDKPLPESVMQSLASEFNLSETAYLEPLREGQWGLRWFTPEVEVDLCGHATLAAAHALWESGVTNSDRIEFATRSGILTVMRQPPSLMMSFPRVATTPVDDTSSLRPIAPGLVNAATAGADMLLELSDQQAVESFLPDLAAIAALPCRGVMVTAAGQHCDFVSRFFAPGVGIDEDPVTGSAHCALADYWSSKLGKTALSARQLSQRGGAIDIELSDSGVTLQGRAVTVATGQVLL